MNLNEANTILLKEGYMMKENTNTLSKEEKFKLLALLIEASNDLILLSDYTDTEVQVAYHNNKDTNTYFISHSYFSSPDTDVDPKSDKVIVSAYYDDVDEQEEPDDEYIENISDIIKDIANNYI